MIERELVFESNIVFLLGRIATLEREGWTKDPNDKTFEHCGNICVWMIKEEPKATLAEVFEIFKEVNESRINNDKELVGTKEYYNDLYQLSKKSYELLSKEYDILEKKYDGIKNACNYLECADCESPFIESECSFCQSCMEDFNYGAIRKLKEENNKIRDQRNNSQELNHDFRKVIEKFREENKLLKEQLKESCKNLNGFISGKLTPVLWKGQNVGISEMIDPEKEKIIITKAAANGATEEKIGCTGEKMTEREK